MNVFDLDIADDVISAVVAHAERDFPVEACGFLVGPRDSQRVTRAEPMANVQDRYHRQDPARFSRDGRTAFRLDELERMRMLDRLEGEGCAERVLYHSHCDAGAYFSPEDRAMAIRDGIDMLPGIVHLVVSVVHGVAREAAVFRYDAQRETFFEERVSIPGVHPSTPVTAADLDLRGRSPKGSVHTRLVTTTEAEAIARECTGRVDVDESTEHDLIRFGLGLWSPLRGFMTKSEAESVSSHQRLLDGTWFCRPVSLRANIDPRLLEPGRTLLLVGTSGHALGALVVRGHGSQDNFCVGGDVFVWPAWAKKSALDFRAEWLRRDAKRILAVFAPNASGAQKRKLESMVLRLLSHDGFDAVLAQGVLDDAHEAVQFRWATGDAWCDAKMAQNAGATHIWVDDHAAFQQIRATLDIQPVSRPS